VRFYSTMGFKERKWRRKIKSCSANSEGCCWLATGVDRGKKERTLAQVMDCKKRIIENGEEKRGGGGVTGYKEKLHKQRQLGQSKGILH